MAQRPRAPWAIACAVILLALSAAVAADRSGTELLDGILNSKEPVKAGGYFKLMPKEITALTEALIHRLDTNLNATAASVKNPSWDATIGPSIRNDDIADVVSPVITFPSSVSPDSAVRDAALKAADRLSSWGVDAGLRTDVYAAVKAFNGTPEAKALTGEQARLLKFAMRDARRSGLELPKDKRDQLAVLLKKSAKLGLDFQACLDEDTTTLSFTPAELNGTDPEWIASHPKDPKEPGKVLVTVKYPDFDPVMRQCTVESTRQRMSYAFNTVCGGPNTKRLDELVGLRSQIASLLGYPTWAAYVQETNMAKNPQRVGSFLEELRGKLEPLRKSDMARVVDMKRSDKEASGLPFDPVINAWESGYYMNKVEKKYYAVDSEELKKYFPLEHVLSVMFQIYQEMLGLRFEKDDALAKAAWAPGVEAFKAYDSKTGELIGVFFLDLHPRVGKYSHAAMFGLQKPSVFHAGSGKPERIIGAASLVCNFPASTPTQPSLLPHDDVVTLFHEFGHNMHQLLARTNLSSFAGTSVDTDFVEAPSQMLENWAWQPSVLRRLSKHYKTGQPLPEDLISKLVKSRVANSGLINARQLAFGIFDQTIHTSSPPVSTRDVYNKTMQEVWGVRLQDGTAAAARFSHMIGYDAQYYSYLWSQVFSADMFRARFLKDGLTNPKPGRDYRNDILAPGGSIDPDVLLRRFLGRDPTQEAFLISIGLDDSAAKASNSISLAGAGSAAGATSGAAKESAAGGNGSSSGGGLGALSRAMTAQVKRAGSWLANAFGSTSRKANNNGQAHV